MKAVVRWMIVVGAIAASSIVPQELYRASVLGKGAAVALGIGFLVLGAWAFEGIPIAASTRTKTFSKPRMALLLFLVAATLFALYWQYRGV